MTFNRFTGRRLGVLAATAALVAALAGCSAPAPSAGGGDGESYDITLALAVQAGCPFCISVQRGAEAAAEELGVNLTTISPTTPDTASQIKQLAGVIANPPDVLILQPFDADALLPTVNEFKTDGIPTITVDGDIADTSARLTLISSDNEEGGRFAADQLAEAIGETGKVAYLGYTPGLAGTDARQKGFEEQIATYPDIEYLGAQFSADDQAEVAGQVAALLQADPDLAGIFAGAESHAIGASAALRDAASESTVTLVAFDAAPDEVQALRDGSISLLIAQKAFDMGKLAVEQAVAYLKDGTTPPEFTYTDYVPVTKDNVDEPDISQFLYPAE